jgi:hypothetical protein
MMSLFLYIVELFLFLAEAVPNNHFCERVEVSKQMKDIMHRTNCVKKSNPLGFYTYEHGAWGLMNSGNGGMSEYRYQIDSKECRIEYDVIKQKTLCDILNLERSAQCKSPKEKMKILFMGDSLTSVQHYTFLAQLDKDAFNKCNFAVEFLRSDEMKMSVKGWLETVCAADIIWLNSGGHFHDAKRFKDLFLPAMLALNSTCGADIATGKKRLVFRTTSEGNPLCNSENKTQIEFRNMSQWDEVIGSIIRGTSCQMCYNLYFQYYSIATYCNALCILF